MDTFTTVPRFESRHHETTVPKVNDHENADLPNQNKKGIYIVRNLKNQV